MNKYYKILIVPPLFLLFFLFSNNGYGDLFYTQKEHNKIYNEKVALELELKSLKRQFSNEKSNLASSNRKLQNRINSLKGNIRLLNKQISEKDALSKKRVEALERRIDILKRKGSAREKELIDDHRKRQKQMESTINDLQAKLNKARKDNLSNLRKLREQYESKIDSKERQLANINVQLSDLEKLSTQQRRELKRLENQADELANKLKSEIENGDIRLRRYHNKLIINLDDKISFDSGSARLKKRILPALRKIVSILNKYPENRVIIEGHTDNVPIKSRRFRSNWELSTERALSVLRYILREKRLNPSRFSAAGYGKYNPIVSNKTAQNRALNRRVDIVVLPRVKNK